jgi:TolB-like protein
MMKKKLLLTIGLFLAATLVMAGPITLTVGDFQVESDNPSHRFLGKGLSRLVSAELGKSPNIKLIEREKLQKILEEQELSLSGLADESRQMEIGRLLAAEYIVFGEVIDMGNAVLLSLRMSDVSTGELVWQETTTEKLESYDFIGAFFARSILAHLRAPVEASTERKIAAREVKDVRAIVQISVGVDAADRGDKDRARRAFESVKKLDPENEVAREYLARLGTTTPKFRVETEYYAPAFNPAYLGLLQQDAFFAWGASSLMPPDADDVGFQTVGDFRFKEYPGTNDFGYSFPLGTRLGLAVGYTHGGLDRHVSQVSESFEFHPFTVTQGLSLGVGARISDRWSAGSYFRLTNTKPGEGSSNLLEEELYYNLAAGLVYLAAGGQLIADLQLAWSTYEEWYVDQATELPVRGRVPLIAEGSLITTLQERRLYLALKGITDLYLDDRGGHALRVIPIAEYRPWDFLALRAGYEYSHLAQSDSFSVGYGFLGGFTFRFWKLELSANYTLRERPSRLVPGYLISNSMLLIGIGFEPGWIRR